MSKAVLMSIQPYWVFLIIAKKMGWDIGKEKKIEVRKNFPKDENWNRKVEIYCSKDKKSFNLIPKEYQPLMQKFLGKVIGCFICDRIDKGCLTKSDFIDTVSISYKETCVSINELSKYLGVEGTLGFFEFYGWHISDLKIYDKPRGLNEFKHWVNDKDYDGWNEQRTKIVKGFVLRPLTRLPQSWQFIESLGE